MKSTVLYVAIAYLAGIATYSLIEEKNIEHKIDEMSNQISYLDTMESDTTGLIPCACDNVNRFNIDPAQNSGNVGITDGTACQTMVAGGGTAPARTGDKDLTAAVKGAWFSKMTLDQMFCHKPDANGIFVYKGKDPEGHDTYIIEAGRDNRITTVDDHSSYMYYSHTLCPMVCGICGQ
jgi:hypothetical protein